MDGKVVLLLCAFISASAFVSGAPQSSEESPEFFSGAAKEFAKELKKQMMMLFGNETVNSRSERDAEEGNDQPLVKPEMHFSTLRAEASGSGIPSPTVFVGGFSFMMMPTPEGEQIFNRIMENIPNFGQNNAG